MNRIVLPTLLACTLALYGCRGGEDAGRTAGADTSLAVGGEVSAVDSAFEVLAGTLGGDSPSREKLDAAVTFIEEYPRSRYTLDVLGEIVDCRGRELGDWPGAIAYVETYRASVDDPATALRLDKSMITYYGDAGMKGKMLALASRLDSEGELKFIDRWNVIEAAVALEDWPLVREYCGGAGVFANADSFRSEWSDYEFSDEEVERAGANRKGMLLVRDSWARANLGDIDEALAGFEDAAGYVRHNYLGIPGYDLDRYRARTLMMKGRCREAIDRFARDALVRGDAEAMEGLREAYRCMNGSAEGYDDFAARLHREVAKKIDDFELPGFDGVRRRYADLAGDVTLVIFWSPT